MIKKSVKIVLILCAVLIVLSGILVGFRVILHKPTEEKEIYTVKVETYENIIEISGTVSAAQQQTLQALSAGTVVAVNVKAGDSVKKGDVILQLDNTTELYNLAKHDYDMATTRISGSSRELQLKETQRLSLVQKVEDRKVTATFDGIIADLDVAVGDSLEAKDSVGTLVNIDYLVAEVEVAETDVSKLQKGQEVDLQFSAYPDVIKGYVESWPAIGEITSRGATVVKVKIRIDKYPSGILPNFSFTGKIQIEAPVDNIIVERNAVGYENKKAFVVLAKNEERKEVNVIPYGKDYVKILEGLEGGERLLQQSKSPKSGEKQQRNNSNSQKNNGNTSNRNGNGSGQSGGMPGGGMPSAGGMPPM